MEQKTISYEVWRRLYDWHARESRKRRLKADFGSLHIEVKNATELAKYDLEQLYNLLEKEVQNEQ